MNRFIMMAGVAVSLLCAMKAHAAEFNPIPGAPKVIIMTGDIELNDGAKLQSVLDYRKRRHVPTVAIDINSLGGNVKGALDMANIIDREHLDVAVGADQNCSSACVLLFAAAAHRLVSGHAIIGVHQASDLASDGSRSSDAPGALQATQMMTEAFIRFHVPFQVTRAMNSTDGSSGTYLTANVLAIWPNTTIFSTGQ